MDQTKNSIKSSLEQFQTDGYIVIHNFITDSDCDNLIKEQKNIIDNLSTIEQKVIFNTTNQEHAKHQYFFDSAREIRCFFENDAFDQDGNLVTPIYKAINKIGHALHDNNIIFRDFSYQMALKQLLINLGLEQPKIVQSMYLQKQPKIGNKVDIHQDSTFIYTHPESCIGLWFALEDANISNGCLWAIPQSHLGPLKQRMLSNGKTTHIEIIDDTSYDTTQAIPLEVPKGSVIALHGRLAHYSNYNSSTKSRHAYALHVVDGKTEYSKYNWLQDSPDNRFKDWL